MDNRVKGSTTVEIGGREYTLYFSWDAIAKVEAQIGKEAYDLSDPNTLAIFAAAGFEAYHPDMTADQIKSLSPPLIPLLKAVNRAYNYSYYGNEIIPEEEKAPANPLLPARIVTGLKRFFNRLFVRASDPQTSGI